MDQDIVEYQIPVTDRLRLVYEEVRGQNQIDMMKVAKTNRVSSNVAHERPVWKVGQGAWVYSYDTTFNQELLQKHPRWRQVLRPMLSFNWTGP